MMHLLLDGNALVIGLPPTFGSERKQAVDYGRTAAKKVGTELYIHGRDGTIKDKRSYGNDPMPPRDKK